MGRSDTAKFELRRDGAPPDRFENDLVAQLPGLLITQFTVPASSPQSNVGVTGLRFDFLDDWYSIVAFLDDKKRPTGHYVICTQSPLYNESGVWIGTVLPPEIRVFPGWDYVVRKEEYLSQAVQEGRIRVYAAAKVGDALRKLCRMLDQQCLPQEVMDAVGG